MQDHPIHRVQTMLLTLVLLLSSCAAPPASPVPQPSPAPATDTAAPPPSPTPTETFTPAPTETATLIPTATRTPGPVVLTIWYAYAPGTAEELAFTYILKQVRKEHPDYTIKVSRMKWAGYIDAYRTAVLRGEGPDLLIAPNDTLGADVRKRFLADITELAAGKLENYDPRAIQGMTYENKLYGIPETMKAVVFWYNKSQLPEPPRTTDELKALMQAGTRVAIVYNCYHQFGFYGAFGGKLFDEKWKFTTDQRGFSEGMAYLKELYGISKQQNWPLDDARGNKRFRVGAVAAITNGNWSMADYHSGLGESLAVAPLPAGPGGPATPLLGVDGFYINPNSPIKDVALEIALRFTNVEAQQYMMANAGHVPVRTDVEITDPLIQGLLEAFENAYVRPQVPKMGNYWSNFCTTEEVFEKGLAPDYWVRRSTVAANAQIPDW